RGEPLPVADSQEREGDLLVCLVVDVRRRNALQDADEQAALLIRRVPPAMLNRRSAPATRSFRTSARIWPATCNRSNASLTSIAFAVTPRARQNSITFERASRLFAWSLW